MSKKIVFITKSPFTERDYNSFGIELLSKENEVIILDCSQWIIPNIRSVQKFALKTSMLNYKLVSSITNLLNELRTLNADYYIDYLEDDLKSLFVRVIFKIKKINRVCVVSGPIPYSSYAINKFNYFKKIVLAYKERRLLSFVIHKFLAILQRVFMIFGTKPDIAICSGNISTSFTNVKNAKKIIWAHSFDYDQYLFVKNNKKLSIKNYAVYIDQAAGCHPDVKHIGYNESILAGEDFYSSLNLFFDSFQKDTGLEVIIAAHPKASIDFNKAMFGKRQLVYGKTAELIKDSKLVFEHTSTARSFAIINKIPIVHLTCDHFIRQGINNDIEFASQLLNTKLININKVSNNLNVESWYNINQEAYKNYMERFLKLPNTPELPLWQIYSDYINGK